jgi:hypothetical protein
MQYQWFKIFNRTEFEALGLVSRTYTFTLQGIGLKEILVTKGVGIGMLYDDVFLSLELGEDNPFVFEDLAIYIDGIDDVYLGVAVES